MAEHARNILADMLRSMIDGEYDDANGIFYSAARGQAPNEVIVTAREGEDGEPTDLVILVLDMK